MRRRTTLVSSVAAAAAALALLPATATAGPRTEDARAPAVPRLDWKPCPDADGLMCTRVKVPTDYDRPRGRTTTISLTKLPATGPGRRIGSLFTNPGGPGGSGVDFVKEVGRAAYTPQVRARFDVIGFDPRGVNESDPVTCYRTARAEAKALAALPAFPVTDREARRYVDQATALGRSCARTSPGRTAHASTANVARDLDLLRRAVGDRRLSYVGYSYGTFLGATYARLFPGRIRSMVLDGTLDPPAYSGSNGDPRSVGARTRQGPAGAQVFTQFLRQCRAAGDRCALNALGDPRRVTERMFRDLRSTPVPLETEQGTIQVDYPASVALIFGALYDPARWRDLSATLAYLATGGDGAQPQSSEPLLRTLRPGKQEYESVGGSLASVCMDTRQRIRPGQFQRLANAEDRRAPHFGRYRAWLGVECTRVGVRDTDAYRGPWRQTVKQPVLVIGTRYDPATPYAFTRPFADRFPDGRMLTVRGYGHTTLGKSSCADRAITRYLVDRTAPRDGATCDQDVAPFADPPAGQQQRQPAPLRMPLL